MGMIWMKEENEIWAENNKVKMMKTWQKKIWIRITSKFHMRETTAENQSARDCEFVVTVPKTNLPKKRTQKNV